MQWHALQKSPFPNEEEHLCTFVLQLSLVGAFWQVQ